MESQQLLDLIIVPTLKYMGGGYDSKNARMLLLSTAAIESNCGYYIKQINGPALGVWQMEPRTHLSIYRNCDALKTVGVNNSEIYDKLISLNLKMSKVGISRLITSPMYACAMARLKYSMFKEQLPDYNYIEGQYSYWGRLYNTHPESEEGLDKFITAWYANKLDKVTL